MFFKISICRVRLQPGSPTPLGAPLPDMPSKRQELQSIRLIRVAKSGGMQFLMFAPIAISYAEVLHHLYEACSD
jgi:hypothetical protein